MKMLRDSYASSTHFTSPSPRLCVSRGRPSQMHARNTHATARVPHSRARTRLLTFSILHARCPLPLAAGRTRVLCVSRCRLWPSSLWWAAGPQGRHCDSARREGARDCRAASTAAGGARAKCGSGSPAGAYSNYLARSPSRQFRFPRWLTQAQPSPAANARQSQQQATPRALTVRSVPHRPSCKVG